MNLKDKIHLAKLSILASVAPAMLVCNEIIVLAGTTEATTATTGTTAGSEVTKKIEKAGNSVWSTAQIVCKVAVLVALAIVGLIMIIGTKNMKEAVKENIYYIAGGMAIVYLAGDICDWLDGTLK